MNITLPHTVPMLYMNRDRRGLEIVSDNVGITVPMLFMHHAPAILAQVFMLPKPGQSTSAYNFIITILTEHISKDSNIEIAENPVAGFGVETITKLIVLMGDNDPGTLQAVSVGSYLESIRLTTYR